MPESTCTTNDRDCATVDDLRSLIRDAEQALSTAGGQTADEVQALRERFREILAQGQTKLKNFTDAARRQAGHADETIRANPYQSIGIAAGVGLLLGFLISRSCSNNSH
jgi:ElaB protein